MSDAPDSSSRWSSWLETHASCFFHFARQQTRCESDAEDVLQDALVESWNRSGGNIPDASLVYATIRRRAIDLGRSADSRNKRERGHHSATEFLELPESDRREEVEALLVAVRELPPDQQEVVHLRVWGELSFKDIAAAVSAPLPTVASRFQAALKRLNTILTQISP